MGTKNFPPPSLTDGNILSRKSSHTTFSSYHSAFPLGSSPPSWKPHLQEAHTLPPSPAFVYSLLPLASRKPSGNTPRTRTSRHRPSSCLTCSFQLLIRHRGGLVNLAAFVSASRRELVPVSGGPYFVSLLPVLLTFPEPPGPAA